MKKNLMIGLLSSAAVLSLVSSCSDDYNPMSSSSGLIQPRVDINSDVVKAKKNESRDASSISVSDLALKLTSADGSVAETWTSVDAFDTDREFKVGSYTMEAYYGSLDDEGFEKPYYYGMAPLTVKENQRTPVELTAKLANTMVSVSYTDAFKNYFTSYSLQLHAEGGAYVEYPAGETRPAYLRPGKVTILATIVKPNGVGATLEAASFVAQAQHHYAVTIDVNGGNVGEAQLQISFDELLDEEVIDIDLSDELLNAPAPEITADGFEPDQTYTIIDGMSAEINPKFNIIARGGIGAVTLTTESASLIEQGWPSEIDLISATDAQQAKLKSLGLNALGVFGNVDRMAVVDFTNVIPSIKYREGGNNDIKFTIVVKDKIGKVTEPVSLNLSCEPVILEISDPSALPMYYDNVNIQVAYNGTDLKDNVKFEYENERGRWTEATINSVSAVSRSTETYSVNITVPADEEAVTVRAVSGKVISNTLKIERGDAPYDLTGSENNVFATYAIANVVDKEGKSVTLPAGATVEVSTDGTNFSAAATEISDNSCLISGLAPATTYYAIVKGGDKSAAYRFTTETALQVPNGDFEELGNEINATLFQGAAFAPTAGIAYINGLKYTIKEPVGWATVNDKTANLSHIATNASDDLYKAQGSVRVGDFLSTKPQIGSWFVIPSTYNTSLYWESEYLGIGIFSASKNYAVPEVYKAYGAQNGDNAMVLRNVGWDEAGTVPSVRVSIGSSNDYYNNKVPSLSNYSAGKLFLGSYSYSNGVETYNEGVSFQSRPSSLKGHYIYVNDSQDTSETGTVTVTLLNGNDVIGTGACTLSAVNQFSEFKCPIKYVDSAAKATSLRIMITSSNHASYNQADETSSIKTTAYNGRTESASRGATLVVDNLSFNY